jgi:hypothetical protein
MNTWIKRIVVAAVMMILSVSGVAQAITIDFEADPLPYIGASLTQGGYSLTPASGTMSATRVDSNTGEVHSGSYAASLVVGDADPDGPYVRINRPSSDYIDLRNFVSISWWTRVQDGADEDRNYVTIGLDPDIDEYNDLWVVSYGDITATGSNGWVQKTISLTSLCHVAAYDEGEGSDYQFGGRGDLGPTSDPTHDPTYAAGDWGPIGDLFSIGYDNAIPSVASTDYGHLGINAFLVGCSEAGSGDLAWFVDDVQVQLVPEPATMALLGLGGLLIRRKK